VGLFSGSKSSSTISTEINTQTLAGGVLGDLDFDSAQAIGAQLENIVDSDIGLSFEQHGLSGSDVADLLIGTIGAVGEAVIKPTQVLTGDIVRGFGASQSTTAALTGTFDKLLNTVKDLGIPLIIGVAAVIWLRNQ
jgi:hypothetical protein